MLALPEVAIADNSIHHMDLFALCNAMGDASVDMILCDLPYGVLNEITSADIRIFNKGLADKIKFDLVAFCNAIDRIAKDWVYVFCSTEQVSTIRSYFFKLGYMTRLGIWEKTNPSPVNGQYMWLSSIETCVIARKPRAIFNEFCVSSVWRFPSGKRGFHPTQKPVDLFEYLILSSTKEGALVFDPCVGSGTTAVACLNTNRRYICGDFTREYVELARDRVRNSDPFQASVDRKTGIKQLSLFEGAI